MTDKKTGHISGLSTHDDFLDDLTKNGHEIKIF